MTIERRRLLAGAAGLGAWTIGRSLMGSGATARGREVASAPPLIDDVYGMGVRRDAHTLDADSDDVRIYRDAVAWMKARSVKNPLDPLGWAQHWTHHSIFCATSTFAYQIHYGWFFLPWHRAYLFNLEQKIRRVTKEPSFAFPYWDWTRHKTVPDWYWGADNPLANRTRLQEPGDALPNDFLEVGPILRARRWDHFGGRKRANGDLQVEGTLEQSCHNNVHNWTGGELASFDGAGNDPLFQSHHGQVDRLWEAWLKQGEDRANPADPEWAEHLFWFYGWSDRPEYLQVGRLQSTKDLGYRYDRYDFRSTLPDEERPRYTGGGLDFGGITPSLAVRRAAADPSGRERISLSYERMSLPIHPFCHRLFFVAEDTDIPPAYVGTFTILPIPDLNQGLERTVTSQVEVPPEARSILEPGVAIRVVGVPVPLKGRDVPSAPVPFGGVSIVVET